jgi:hypothetical protein
MEDTKIWLVKILLPSLVAISIKLAIQSKKKSVTWFNVITSFIIGIGSAYLCSDLVISTISHDYVPIAIAIITISGEKIGFWLVYKMNVENILEGLLEKIKNKK